MPSPLAVERSRLRLNGLKPFFALLSLEILLNWRI
jgi:hypothetical protein